MRAIRLLVPANIGATPAATCTTRLVQAPQALGVDVDVLAVEGSWPESTAKNDAGCSLLGEWEPEGQHGSVAIWDGLIAMGAPDELELAARARQETWVLPGWKQTAAHVLDVLGAEVSARIGTRTSTYSCVRCPLKKSRSSPPHSASRTPA